MFCCEALIAECEACKAQMTVEEYCKENPKMMGCEIDPSEFCERKECGVPCEDSMMGGYSVCNGKGQCVAGELNPCEQHGCDGKKCGENCLMGDIMGWCDHRGTCDYIQENVKCGNKIKKLIYYSG